MRGCSCIVVNPRDRSEGNNIAVESIRPRGYFVAAKLISHMLHIIFFVENYHIYLDLFHYLIILCY